MVTSWTQTSIPRSLRRRYTQVTKVRTGYNRQSPPLLTTVIGVTHHYEIRHTSVGQIIHVTKFLSFRMFSRQHGCKSFSTRSRERTPEVSFHHILDPFPGRQTDGKELTHPTLVHTSRCHRRDLYRTVVSLKGTGRSPSHRLFTLLGLSSSAFQETLHSYLLNSHTHLRPFSPTFFFT